MQRQPCQPTLSQARFYLLAQQAAQSHQALYGHAQAKDNTAKETAQASHENLYSN